MLLCSLFMPAVQGQTATTDYAVSYSVAANGYKKLVAKKKRRIVIQQGFNPVPYYDLLLVVARKGLDVNGPGQTPRDTLRAIYPDEPISEMSLNRYDSVSNTLTVHSYTGMTSFELVYSFDSLGRLARLVSQGQMAIPGSEFLSEMTWRYFPEKHMVTTSFTSDKTKHVTETTWDVYHRRPLAEKITKADDSSVTQYVFTWRNNSLYRLQTTETSRTKKTKHPRLTYYFSK